MKNQSKNEFSARSQRSLVQEAELRRQLDYVGTVIRNKNGEIVELEALKATWMKNSLKPGGDQFVRLAASADLRSMRDELAVHEERRDLLRGEIAKLSPNPSQAKERAKQQEQLRDLVAQRLEKDWLLERGLESFRGWLQERADLTTKMAECATAIDLNTEGDALDAVRFDALLASLPADLGAASEARAGWFLGTEKDAKTYVVRDDILVVPETLAHSGVYHLGEKIDLSDDQARELLREDRRAATDDKPWRLAPPSLVTHEAFEQAAALAEQRGISIEDLWAHENLGHTKAQDNQHIESILDRTRLRREGGDVDAEKHRLAVQLGLA